MHHPIASASATATLFNASPAPPPSPSLSRVCLVVIESQFAITLLGATQSRHIVRRRAPLIAAYPRRRISPSRSVREEARRGSPWKSRRRAPPREDMGPAFLPHVGAHERAEERGVPIVGRDTVADASRCAGVVVDGGTARMGEEDARIVVAREGGRMR